MSSKSLTKSDEDTDETQQKKPSKPRKKRERKRSSTRTKVSTEAQEKEEKKLEKALGQPVPKLHLVEVALGLCGQELLKAKLLLYDALEVVQGRINAQRAGGPR